MYHEYLFQKRIREGFMDIFIVYDNLFDACVENLTLILKRCMKCNLVLNYKKCHFMFVQGIVLGYIVFATSLEFNKDKIYFVFIIFNSFI